MNEKSSAKEKEESQNQTEPQNAAAGAAGNRAEKALAEVTAAKAAIQSDADSIHASRAEIDGIKGQAKTLHDGVAADLTSFTELKSKVTGLINDAEKKAAQISLEHDSVGSQLAELKKAQTGLKEFLDGMEKTKLAAEISRDAVAAAEKAVGETKGRFDELATNAQTSHSEMIKSQTTATTKAGEIETLFAQTQQHFDALFKDEKDESGNFVKKSVATQLQELYGNSKKDLEESQRELVAIREALTTLEKSTALQTKSLRDDAEAKMTELATETKTQFTTLYKELKDRIESLLPGAGAAGLASTYFEAKGKYGFTPIKIKEDDKHPNWTRIFHYGKTLTVTLSFYTMFLAPLGGIAYIFWLIINSLLEHPDQLKDFNTNITRGQLIIE